MLPRHALSIGRITGLGATRDCHHGLLENPRWVLLLAVVMFLISLHDASAQQSFATGQNIAPAYEGWERNPDGSFNLVFGYMNRNWEEEIDVPIGLDNSIAPGSPDQGQPTHFLPRRSRFVFAIRVPADFGNKELVWTLTSNGQTERAYATLKRDYFLDKLVIQANFGAGGPGGTTPELPDNEAPTLALEGDRLRTAGVGQPLIVPHPVLWTQVNATPPGVARAPRGPRSVCDTRASRAARSCCTAPRTRSLRRVPP